MPKLSRKTKLIYGSGDVGFSMTNTVLASYFAIYLTYIIGLDAVYAAIIFFIGKSWDYINDPLVGYISDRTRSRWGRRRPFLLFGAVPFAVMFIFLWITPPFTEAVPLIIYYSLAYILFEVSATFVYMPYFALTPELADDYDERTSLTSYRMFFSIFGSLVSFILPGIIVGNFQNPDNGLRALYMGIFFGVISALPLLFVFFGTKEKPLPEEPEDVGLFESIKEAFKNRPFLYSLGIFLCTWMAVDILQTSLVFYIYNVIDRQPHEELIMASIFVVAILALPIWNWFAQRFSKRWAYIYGISFWAAIQIFLVLLGPATPLPLVLFFCVMAGIGVSVAHVLPWAILPDSVEWDEWKNGTRREGMFYSLTTLSRKVAASISIPLSLLVMDLTGFDANAAVQTPVAVLGIRLVVGPIPAILLLVGIFLAYRYPLTREKFINIQRLLKRRNNNKQDTKAIPENA